MSGAPLSAPPPPEMQGEIGASFGGATDGKAIFAGTTVRAGFYMPRRGAIPMLLGNRLGVDAELHTLYGRSASGIKMDPSACW